MFNVVTILLQTECASKNILKIGQYLIGDNIHNSFWLTFLGHPVHVTRH